MKIDYDIPIGAYNKEDAAKVIAMIKMLKDAPIGASVLMEPNKAFSSAYSYARMYKIKIARRKEGDKFRFWRMPDGRPVKGIIDDPLARQMMVECADLDDENDQNAIITAHSVNM